MIDIQKNEFKAIENGNFKFPDGSVRRAIINNYCIWNNKNYQHELKRLQSFDKVWDFSVCYPKFTEKHPTVSCQQRTDVQF